MHYSPEVRRGLAAFGFDEKEVKIYLAGLELGPSTTLELSRRTEFPRTTLYPLLERLSKQGVFRVGLRKKTTVYSAEPPSVLERIMTERGDKLHKTIPMLEILKDTAEHGGSVTLYEGTDGFKRLWKQMLRSGVKEYRLITTGTGLLDYVKEPYIVKRLIAERVERGIHSKQLIPIGQNAKKIVEKDKAELRESRFLPAGTTVPATVIVFGENVAFITTRKENAMILLASGDIARTYETLFDLIWDKAQMPC
ncbi:MAG: helix-turn-helix domain-containing protein [Patescibacteria group bacterium]